MFRKNQRFLHVLLATMCGLAFLVAWSPASADDYRVYSYFNAPGSPYLVWAAGGYVQDYGVPGTWGDEIQYIYFIQIDFWGGARTAHKVRVWVTNEGSPSDPTPYIDIDQHPAHPDLDHIGPIEPRHFEIVTSVNITAYSDDGGWGADEFHVDATGVYLGAWPHGIHKFDHDLNYIGQIANPPPVPYETQTLAYNHTAKTWYAGNYNREILQLSDTDEDGDFMDETWQFVFTHTSYAGSHHDGMEYVGGYLWISDMTSDVIGQWKYDSDTDSWVEVATYTYSEGAVVEGMGYGPNASFWIGGYGSGYVYELHGAISCGYPVADAGEDVSSYPPTIPVELDGFGSYYEKCPDAEGREIILYEWDCEGDGVYDYSGTDPTTTCTYPAVYNPDGSIDWTATAQTYTATLRVTDNTPDLEGGPLTSVDTCEVHITAPPWQPVVDPNGPYNPKVNNEVCLDGSGSYHPAADMYEPGHPWYDNIISWEWDLDNDGQFDDSTGEIVCTQWPTVGTYFVCLRVTDGAGETNVKCTTVIVGTGIHDVAVEDVTPSKSTGIVPGEVVTIDVDVSNPGDYTESFDVNLTYDSVVIGTDNVPSLINGGSVSFPFSWDTTGVAEGTYTIKACADIVPGEIIVDNNCLETTVEVNPNQPPIEHVVLIIVDGLRKDVLDDALKYNNHPTLKLLFKDTPHVKFEEVYTIFPSVTFPANASLVTGANPNSHGIAGNSWFDRFRILTDRHVDYADMGAPYLDLDLFRVYWNEELATKDLNVKTVYDYLCENSKDFLISFHMFGSKYCDNSNSWIKPDVWSDGILFVTGKDQASEYILDLLDITTTNDAFAIYDENMIFEAAKKINENGELPNLLTLYFAGHDGKSHVWGVGDQSKYLQNVIDPLLSSFINGGFFTKTSLGLDPILLLPTIDFEFEDFDGLRNMEKDGISYFDNTVFVIVSDHGQSNIIDKAKTRNKINSYCADNGGMAQVYVQNTEWFDEWDEIPRFQQDVLPIAKKYWEKRVKDNIEYILVRDSQTSGNWGSSYYLYEYLEDEKRHNLKLLDFGLLTNNRINNLSSKYSGDIILLPKNGYSFGRKKGGDHGNIHDEDSHIPLIFSSSLFQESKSVSNTAEIIDVAPTISKLLGVEMSGDGVAGMELVEVTSLVGD